MTEDGSLGLDRKNGLDLASNVVDLELLSTLGSAEGRILRTSLAFLHLWGANLELDKCLQKELRITPPMSIGTAAGFAGDRGATTLLLPGWKSTFEVICHIISMWYSIKHTHTDILLMSKACDNLQDIVQICIAFHILLIFVSY